MEISSLNIMKVLPEVAFFKHKKKKKGFIRQIENALFFMRECFRGIYGR